MSLLVKSVRAMGWMVEKANIIRRQAEYIAVCEQALLDAARLRDEQELWLEEVKSMLSSENKRKVNDGFTREYFIREVRRKREPRD